MFAGARPMHSKQQWLEEVDAAWMDSKNPTPDWWAELHVWCQSTQFKAVQDMAFHDKPSWLNAWVIRDQPTTSLPPLACYDSWLQHWGDLTSDMSLPTQAILLTSFCNLSFQFQHPFPMYFFVTCPCVHPLADVMVPSLERTYKVHV